MNHFPMQNAPINSINCDNDCIIRERVIKMSSETASINIVCNQYICYFLNFVPESVNRNDLVSVIFWLIWLILK